MYPKFVEVQMLLFVANYSNEIMNESIASISPNNDDICSFFLISPKQSWTKHVSVGKGCVYAATSVPNAAANAKLHVKVP